MGCGPRSPLLTYLSSAARLDRYAIQSRHTEIGSDRFVAVSRPLPTGLSSSITCTCPRRPAPNGGREAVCLVFAEKWCSGAPARTAARSLVADALALAGQIRRFKANCREVRHSVAVEPVIGDHKDGCLMRRNYFKGRDGDRIDALPAAGGFNFRPLLAPFAKLSRALLLILSRGFPSPRPCVPHGFPGKSPH